MTYPPPRTPPSASTHRSRRISIIWIVPIVALLIGAYLAWDTLSKEGPTIKITFDSGEGLQAGQSQLKYKDIVFGTVKSLELTPDQWHVIVTVKTTREATPLLTDKTVFWVVKPRLFAGSVSGLETVLSGSYVGMVPGDADGKPQREFKGQEDPPILEAHIPGRIFELKSTRIGSISVGSPVFFRDLAVGEVLGWDVANMAESVTIRAFIRAPYDAYVNDNTRFWNASGLSIKLGASGIEFQMESLKALILGGIAFETKRVREGTTEASENHVFPLFADRDAANSASYTRMIPAVSYFSNSVRGLAPGSEVTMHGIKIGTVTDVRLTPDQSNGTIRARVTYEAQPERIVGVGKREYKTEDESMAAMMKLRLRASLESASLITGQQVVAIDFVPDAPELPVTKEGDAFVVPSIESGGFASLAASATEVLNKLNTIPFKQIGGSINGILSSVDNATQGPELKDAIKNLAATLASAQDLVKKIDTGASPAMRQLPEISATLQRALTNVVKLTASFDSGYGNETKFYRDLDRLLVQTDDAVRSFRSLADMLARHPEVLIRGRPAGGVE